MIIKKEKSRSFRCAQSPSVVTSNLNKDKYYMSNNLEHFMKSFVHANERKAKQHVQTKRVQQMVNSNVVGTSTNTTNTTVSAKTTAKTTTRMTEEQYRTSIIAKAIAYIKQKGAM
jgi:uncharacterized membrane protein